MLMADNTETWQVITDFAIFPELGDGIIGKY